MRCLEWTPTYLHVLDRNTEIDKPYHNPGIQGVQDEEVQPDIVHRLMTRNSNDDVLPHTNLAVIHPFIVHFTVLPETAVISFCRNAVHKFDPNRHRHRRIFLNNLLMTTPIPVVVEREAIPTIDATLILHKFIAVLCVAVIWDVVAQFDRKASVGRVVGRAIDELVLAVRTT